MSQSRAVGEFHTVVTATLSVRDCPRAIEFYKKAFGAVQLYLRSVLARLPALRPEDLQNYLPDVWKRELVAEQRAALNAYHASVARGIAK